MKKLTIIFLILFTQSIFSQYTIILKLVTSNGYTPNTGQASNIAFTRYPHSYPTDVVSGITVTESGTTGTYKCKGFTTYEYVKVWLSGSEYTAFDSIQVGSITSYLSSNYISKTSTQTGISGTKTLTGDWLWTSGTVTINKPYIYTSSPWYTDYSLLGNSSIGWKGLNDSLYVLRDWMFKSGSKIILQSGYKIWGLGNTQPIQIYTSQFSWDATNGLTLINPLNYDSLTIRKDTTISENPYYKTWSAKRRFWSQTDSLTLYWQYKNTLYNTTDSFQVINNVVSVDVESSITLGTSNTKLDSVYLTAGLWSINFGFNYKFSDASLGGAPTIQPDSLIMCGTKSGGSTLFDNVMATQQYFNGVNYGEMGTLTWHCDVQVTTPIWVYLNGRRKNTETALGHLSKHHYISALKVR